jgi:hypothetical protein
MSVKLVSSNCLCAVCMTLMAAAGSNCKEALSIQALVCCACNSSWTMATRTHVGAASSTTTAPLETCMLAQLASATWSGWVHGHGVQLVAPKVSQLVLQVRHRGCSTCTSSAAMMPYETRLCWCTGTEHRPRTCSIAVQATCLRGRSGRRSSSSHVACNEPLCDASSAQRLCSAGWAHAGCRKCTCVPSPLVVDGSWALALSNAWNSMPSS